MLRELKRADPCFYAVKLLISQDRQALRDKIIRSHKLGSTSDNYPGPTVSSRWVGLARPFPRNLTPRGSLPFSRSVRKGGALTCLSAADHRVHSKLLAPTRRSSEIQSSPRNLSLSHSAVNCSTPNPLDAPRARAAMTLCGGMGRYHAKSQAGRCVESHPWQRTSRMGHPLCTAGWDDIKQNPKQDATVESHPWQRTPRMGHPLCAAGWDDIKQNPKQDTTVESHLDKERQGWGTRRAPDSLRR